MSQPETRVFWNSSGELVVERFDRSPNGAGSVFVGDSPKYLEPVFVAGYSGQTDVGQYRYTLAADKSLEGAVEVRRNGNHLHCGDEDYQLRPDLVRHVCFPDDPEINLENHAFIRVYYFVDGIYVAVTQDREAGSYCIHIGRVEEPMTAIPVKRVGVDMRDDLLPVLSTHRGELIEAVNEVTWGKVKAKLTPLNLTDLLGIFDNGHLVIRWM